MNIALKEWASVVAALEAGLQVCLLRKGGIVEADRGGFQLRYRRFLLFPTYEHEHALLVKDQFKSLVTETREEFHELSLVCEVTDVVTTSGYETVQAASEHFIWNDAFLRKRLDYKPNLPLYALLLRAYRLPSPIRIPDRPSYAGCKSWVHLTEEIDVSRLEPVLTDAEFARRSEALLDALQLALR
ncbi:MAG TPA: DUF1802 family protein [Bryobacteraceae bacterium]|nr:DUF1802 family protein [Bryobacteraceae bacterium]